MGENEGNDPVSEALGDWVKEISARPDILKAMEEKPNETGWSQPTVWEERKKRATQIILTSEQARRDKLKAEKRDCKEFPVHLFPGHPKAPYLGRSGLFSASINIAYTAEYLRDFRASSEGKPSCSEETLSERTYIALVARAMIEHTDPVLRDSAIKILEDIIVPDMLERYGHLGYNEDYARGALVPACAKAMEEGFSAKINNVDMMLYRMFKRMVLNEGNGE
jgi:hypothetical protein